MTRGVGDTISAPEQVVRPEMMRVWAQVLRDPNPIHLDPDAVRARGLGDRVINQGPGNVSYIMNMLLAAFPQGRLDSIEVRFLDNVFGGELVAPAAIVRDIEDNGDGQRISLNITLHANGRLVLDGEAAVLTPSA